MVKFIECYRNVGIYYQKNKYMSGYYAQGDIYVFDNVDDVKKWIDKALESSKFTVRTSSLMRRGAI